MQRACWRLVSDTVAAGIKNMFVRFESHCATTAAIVRVPACVCARFFVVFFMSWRILHSLACILSCGQTARGGNRDVKLQLHSEADKSE